MKMNKNLSTNLATLTLMMGASSVIQAATLVGAGSHLPIPSLPHNTPANSVAPLITTVSGGFTGTWSSPADSDWYGTYNATGDVPTSGSVTSTSYDFTPLSLSSLPVGSIFILGDLDDGENSTISFQAFDASGGLLTHWLDEPYSTQGTGTGSGGSVLTTNLPGWEWEAGSSTYIFDGGTTGGNPTLAVLLHNNQAISSLNAVTSRSSNNFGISAPSGVPEPSSILLLGLGGMGLVMRRKRVS